jgi:DNA transformation protein
MGSVEAFKAVKASQNDELSIELLWALEGALNGTHWSVISQERRNELMSSL